MNPPLAPRVMKGGAQVYMADLVAKFSQPLNLYVLIGLALAIVFVKKIPLAIRAQAGSFLGRLFLFVATLAVAEYYSWTNGLLMAVLALLLLSMSPRPQGRDGFQTLANLRLITDDKRWFVEKVLKENPVAIGEEVVKTQAVQDNSNSSRSTNGQGGAK